MCKGEEGLLALSSSLFPPPGKAFSGDTLLHRCFGDRTCGDFGGREGESSLGDSAPPTDLLLYPTAIGKPGLAGPVSASPNPALDPNSVWTWMVDGLLGRDREEFDGSATESPFDIEDAVSPSSAPTLTSPLTKLEGLGRIKAAFISWVGERTGMRTGLIGVFSLLATLHAGLGSALGPSPSSAEGWIGRGFCTPIGAGRWGEGEGGGGGGARETDDGDSALRLAGGARITLDGTGIGGGGGAGDEEGGEEGGEEAPDGEDEDGPEGGGGGGVRREEISIGEEGE